MNTVNSKNFLKKQAVFDCGLTFKPVKVYNGLEAEQPCFQMYQQF